MHGSAEIRGTAPPPAELPRAPSTQAWEAMSQAERETWIARLGPLPFEAMPPVGDPHIEVERAAEDSVAFRIREAGLKAYVGRGLAVYYPDESAFAPDLFVVLDVAPHQRASWFVSAEGGRGLDFVLEVHFRGDRQKDMDFNRERYAKLGIPEYFVFDVGRQALKGWSLESGTGRYAPIVPQAGRWTSRMLGLDLVVRDRMLRFLSDGALIPLTRELMAALEEALAAALARAEEEADLRAAAEEAARAAEARALAELEARLAAEARARAAEEELARLRAEVERLRGG